MTPAVVQDFAAVAGLVLAAIGLPFLILQLRDVQRSMRSASHAAIYQQASDFRSHLVDHPGLRRYFFDGVEVDESHEEYDRILTLAELFLNYLEHVAVTIDSFGHGNRAALERFITSALSDAPILRARLAASPAAYSDRLLDRLPEADAVEARSKRGRGEE